MLAGRWLLVHHVPGATFCQTRIRSGGGDSLRGWMPTAEQRGIQIYGYCTSSCGSVAALRYLQLILRHMESQVLHICFVVSFQVANGRLSFQGRDGITT